MVFSCIFHYEPSILWDTPHFGAVFWDNPLDDRSRFMIFPARLSGWSQGKQTGNQIEARNPEISEHRCQYIITILYYTHSSSLHLMQLTKLIVVFLVNLSTKLMWSKKTSLAPSIKRSTIASRQIHRKTSARALEEECDSLHLRYMKCSTCGGSHGKPILLPCSKARMGRWWERLSHQGVLQIQWIMAGVLAKDPFPWFLCGIHIGHSNKHFQFRMVYSCLFYLIFGIKMIRYSGSMIRRGQSCWGMGLIWI